MQEINSLTAESILEDDVFCEIFDQDDEIYKARLLLTLTDRASELGVKVKFEKLVQAYKKEKARYDKENKEIAPVQVGHDGMTHFGGDYAQMNCGMWQADNNGIRIYTPFGEKSACTHPIMPIQILTNAETGFAKVKLAFLLRQKWKEIIVDKEIISSSNKIVALSKYNIRVTSENSKALVQFLSDIEGYNEDLIPEQVSTSKLGWINETFMPYGNDVLFDGDENFKSTFSSIKEYGDYDTWLNLIRKLRKSERIETRFYLAGAFASPLLHKFNALPFIINLYGATGKGKTVALMVATSVWANPEEGKYFVKANGSPASIEIRLDFLNHLPLMIDDLAQIQKKMKDDFSEYVYNLCNGGGKDRATQNLGLQRQRYWKNVIITNSERSLVNETMQGGAINRIIEVEMLADSYIFDDGNEVVELIKQNYGFAGHEFIDAIEDLGDDVIKAIQKDLLTRIVARGKELGIEKEEKQTLPLSVMLTADKIATDYIFKDNIYLDLNTCVDLLKSKGEVDENERAYDFILSDIAIHRNNFTPDARGEYRGEIWGIIEDGYAIIHNNIFKGMCERGNFSGKAFLTWADSHGVLKFGQSAKVKKIKGKASRCIYVKLEQELEVDKDGFAEIPSQEDLPFQ